MNSLIEFLFMAVLGGIFFGFRTLIYWMLDSKGVPLREAWRLGEDEQRKWRRGEFHYSISGRELLIRLAAGVLTAGLLFGIGYAVYRLIPGE